MICRLHKPLCSSLESQRRALYGFVYGSYKPFNVYPLMLLYFVEIKERPRNRIKVEQSAFHSILNGSQQRILHTVLRFQMKYCSDVLNSISSVPN